MATNQLYAQLIVNPAAGAGKTGKHWPAIKAFLKKTGLRFEQELTEAPGHAVELARAAVKKGYKLVVSVGGDGTINEVVNGLYASNSLKDVSLGIIGTGTGGDYIRTIGVPRDYEQACARLANHPRTLTVDLGLVEHNSGSHKEQRIFTNFAGIGFDAEVVRATTKKYKKLGGMASYLAGLLTTFASYRNRDVTITIDGKPENHKICTVMMNNGKYGGGSMFIAPNADISDGMFDVVIIGNISKPDLLISLPRIYKGTHLTHSKITIKRAYEIEISAPSSLAVQADGELLGELPARFSIIPSALHILV